MRFGLVALIVSFAATSAWLNLVPGSTAHWVASGAGTAVLVYLRHRVRRRGLRGLWRWGPSAGLDETDHSLARERGESFWSQLKPRPRHKPRRAPRNAGNDRRASRTPHEKNTSCKSFVVSWYERGEGPAIKRVELITNSYKAFGRRGRDMFTLNDVEMEQLRQYLVENDPRGVELLEWIVQSTLRQPWSDFELNWARRQRESERHEHGEQRRAEQRSQTVETDPIREARELLGVDEHATEETIRQRMRALMQRTHSDKGGSDALFRIVREAGERLIREKSRAGGSLDQ